MQESPWGPLELQAGTGSAQLVCWKDGDLRGECYRAGAGREAFLQEGI